ncbi:hypothetical protein GGF50DRAFT_66813, partial [Schizophyllum commune]
LNSTSSGLYLHVGPTEFHELLSDNQEFEVCLCASCTQAKVSINGSFSPSESDLANLRSGYLPHPHHHSQHDANAHAAEKQARILEDHIQRLQSLTKVLQEHRLASLEFAAQQRAFIAPIRGLPNELLLEIFYLACDGIVLTCPLDESVLVAVRISHVCHRWRMVALGNTRMWAMGIDIDTREDDDRDIISEAQAREFKATVVLHLARSGNQPLYLRHLGNETLTINLGEDNEWGYELFSSNDIFTMATRCRHAVFDDMSLRHVYADPYFENYFPQLQILELTEDAPINPCDVLQNAPHLTCWKQTIPDFRMPEWTCLPRLTRLEMTWMDWPLARGILLDCECIEHLIIAVYTRPVDTATPLRIDIATLPHLETFQARVDPPHTTLGNLFSVMSAPRLEHVRLVYRANALENEVVDEGATDWPQAELRRFLARSGCTMASLELDNLVLSEEERSVLREQLPNVTRLVISNNHLSRAGFPYPGVGDHYEWRGNADAHSGSDTEEET